MGRRDRRNFGDRRPPGRRRYRKIFVVASEGKVTEVEYFRRLNSVRTTVRLHCLDKGDKSSPDQALKAINKHLRSEGIRKGDEAWIVVDADSWEEAALARLHDWSLSDGCRGLAVSNPKFELWILLHFEDGNGASTATIIDQRLRKYPVGTGKHLVGPWLTEERITTAITRARAKDSPPCVDWPHSPPRTTVYRLVERFLAED